MRSHLALPGGEWAVLQPVVATDAKSLLFSASLSRVSLVLVLQSSNDPQPGDLIEISRKVYMHWAVYVGEGYVVHLVGPGKPELLSHQLDVENCEPKAPFVTGLIGFHSSLCDDIQSFY